MKDLEFEEAAKFRTVIIRLRMEYSVEEVGRIMVPIKEDEPWEDVVNYVYANIELEEAACQS